jgi:hypothetical protein
MSQQFTTPPSLFYFTIFKLEKNKKEDTEPSIYLFHPPTFAPQERLKQVGLCTGLAQFLS